MNDAISQLAEVDVIFRRAIQCNACFVCQETTLQRALVDVAQPRPVGENYWLSDVRIVLVLLNPGAGKVAHAGPNQRFNRLLHAYADGSGTLEAVFQHQREEMPTWGSGQFRRLYLDGYGLELSNIATANVAWCAEQEDKYEPLLARCLELHTLSLLRALRPDAVLLAGDKAQLFTPAVQAACPEAEVVPTKHYRAFSFLSPEEKQRHLNDIRDRLDRVRKAKRIGTDEFELRRQASIGPAESSRTSDGGSPRETTLQRSSRAKSFVTSSRSGNYRVVDRNALLRRANNSNDPRWVFYEAMINLDTYEDYYSQFGDMKVHPETYRSSPRTAHTEMAWARKQGWIQDA